MSRGIVNKQRFCAWFFISKHNSKFSLVHAASYRGIIIVLAFPLGKVSVYRLFDCLSQDLSVFPSVKGLGREKKEIIFRLAPLPGRSSFHLPSLRSAFSIRSNESEKRNSIDRGRSKELLMCHWSKWNHRCTFSSATTIRTPIDKGLRKTQVTPVALSSSRFRHWKRSANAKDQCRLTRTTIIQLGFPRKQLWIILLTCGRR